MMGKHYLQDILDTMGEYIDSLKFAGGSFVLMNSKALKEIIDTAHAHQVLVSAGGFI
jgi:phosphosulfolactate synthase (CoM biosynthesis protein A)